MTIRDLILFLAVAAVGTPANFTVSNIRWGGMTLHIESRLEPDEKKLGLNLPSGVTTTDQGLHRLITDPANRRYLGYTLTVNAIVGTDRYQIHVEPLRMTPEELQRRKIEPSWTRLSPARYPAAAETRISETLAIDLMVNPGTGQKIVDYITLTGSAKAPATEVRDFSVADVMLDLDRPRLKVNGALVEASARVRTGVSGSAVWLYLPDRGRIIFTLFPHPELGFRKAGEVNGHDAVITSGSGKYEITCARRIAPAPGRFHLYVLHDAEWRPRGADADEAFQFGAADKAEWLVRR